jgi:hypothetical protein
MPEPIDIFKSALHESRYIGPADVLRVPGGWIYSNSVGGMAFVPWTRTAKAEEMREALEAVRIWVGAGMDANEHFERIGRMFEKETGFLRPGKDIAPGSYYEGFEADQKREWDLWFKREKKALELRIMDALDMGGI